MDPIAGLDAVVNIKIPNLTFWHFYLKLPAGVAVKSRRGSGGMCPSGYGGCDGRWA
jgi:hypothetical protein